MSMSAPSRENIDVRDLDIDAIGVIVAQPLTAASSPLGSESLPLFGVEDAEEEEDDDEDWDDEDEDDDWDDDEDEDDDEDDEDDEDELGWDDDEDDLEDEDE
jgi:hypothetical protein